MDVETLSLGSVALTRGFIKEIQRNWRSACSCCPQEAVESFPYQDSLALPPSGKTWRDCVKARRCCGCCSGAGAFRRDRHPDVLPPTFLVFFRGAERILWKLRV